LLVTTTAGQDAVQPRTAGKTSRWITDWRPEDAGFWERTGARVARRNLVFSVFSEHVGFSVWSLW
jgi:NNP family nitrate/nitrite transporter-like MFS transporter